ncbi:MAG: CotH kinase family protein [Clostridia bacterium]|nr:CotH kinase family protein [Clostridia bacterium]
MKRVAIIAFVALFMLALFCACGNESPKNATIRVEYKATEGGYIDGQAIQERTALNGAATFDMVNACAENGYIFIGWDDGSVESFRYDTLMENKTFTAIFEKLELSRLTYKATEGGEIRGSAEQTVKAGEMGTAVVAFPNEGYRFIKWSDGVTEPRRNDLADGDKTVTAIFSNKAKIVYRATQGGTIMGATTQDVLYGQKTSEVKAAADIGYLFAGWDDDNKSSQRSDVAQSDVVYTAIFKRYYKFDYYCDTTKGTIQGELNQRVFEGEKSLSVTAKPNEGFDFMCWSNGDTNPTISYTANCNLSLEAYFCCKSSGLPVISIYTDGSASNITKEEYTNCIITVFDKTGDKHVFEQSARIRGRGNSTWNRFDKKPYRIKFDYKQNLFGFGGAKDWVLLADYMDKSLLRNFLAFKIAGEFSSLEASPDCQSVELYLNNEYRGVYLLCEQIEVNEHRVEVSEDTSGVDTGYLVEMDEWNDGTYVWVPDYLNKNRKYGVKFPNNSELTEAHKIFIDDYLTKCMETISASDYDEVLKYVDVDSFAQAYIVFEMFKCPDVDYSSFYLYKEAGGKLYCGPVWDFDMAIGNVNHKGEDVKKYTTLWSRDQNPWFGGLIKHEEFFKLVAKTLYEYKDKITAKLTEYYDYAYSIQVPLKKNFEKWDILGEYVWTNPDYIVKLDTWEEQVEFTRDYLTKSLNFLLESYPYIPNEE